MANEKLIKGVTYETEETVVEKEIDTISDANQIKIDLDGLAALSKAVKKSAAFLTDDQLRIIIDNYEQTQKYRMNIANQIRAVEQEYDESIDGALPAVAWLFRDVKNRENQIKSMIDEYVKNQPVCAWAASIKGIGPVYAAKLWAAIDMSKCYHANKFISYCGLNDHNTPWLGAEKAKEMVNEAYSHFGLKASDECTDDVFLRVAVNSGRNITTVKEGFKRHKEKLAKNTSDKAILTKYLSMPPYNLELKSMCYLIGKSFHMNSNRGSMYGQIYKERKALETMKNDNYEYRAQAEKLLSEKNYDDSKDTYKYLVEGKLSPAHIDQRARRYATKIFLTHFFEAAWIYTHKTNPPTIYPIAHQGHVDYIEPEVPYDSLW